MNKNELEELVMLIDETIHYVKDGGNQHLAQGLLQQHSLISHKLEEMNTDVEVLTGISYEQLESSNSFEELGGISMTDSEEVHCRFCDYEYNHIVTTMQFDSGGESEKVTELTINGTKRIAITELDGLRTKNSHHILFSCGNGHFHIKSYDEHEGIVFTDSNELMDELTMYLNAAYEQSNELDRTFDDDLLQFIKGFFYMKEFLDGQCESPEKSSE